MQKIRRKKQPAPRALLCGAACFADSFSFDFMVFCFLIKKIIKTAILTVNKYKNSID
jgi:hypothetical protein